MAEMAQTVLVPVHGKYMNYRIEVPCTYEDLTVPQKRAWDNAQAALRDLVGAMLHVGPPEESGRYRQGYDDGLAQGYEDAVRDMQIELRNQLSEMQGARPMVIKGYDDSKEYE